MFIFLGTHGVNWITEDCGENIRAINTGRKLESFEFHPFEREWLLASAYKDCSNPRGKPKKRCQ